MLKEFLPLGPIWNKDNTSELSKILDGFESEIARVDSRVHDLIREANPQTTTEMLEAREIEAGLPDPCSGLADTLQGRRDELVNKWSSTGGASISYLEKVALITGITATITDQVTDHTFTVTGPDTTIRSFLVGSSVAGEALRTWGNTSFECIFEIYKPAHTVALYSYTPT